VLRYRRMADHPPGRWLARLIGLRNIAPWTPDSTAVLPGG
jgi:hypothetical protein